MTRASNMKTPSSGERENRRRLRLIVRGAVQGVGFRPFVFRLAEELRLAGWVINSAQGVFIEVEGAPPVLETFLARLRDDPPPRASIQSLEQSVLDPAGYTSFEIRKSDDSGEKVATVLPDIATCPDCVREIFEADNRRDGYPFTNCTNCGPRYSIIEALPYDRPNTTMRAFEMCPACRREYEDPRDRRFHAQPNACPACGPRLELWNEAGAVVASRENALREGARAVREGAILALKGLGGFHLIVDARHEIAVRRLRERKHRDEKPLALMYPSLEWLGQDCVVSSAEQRLLVSPESPIVLLASRRRGALAPLIAPGNPYIGAMLPYTPLHHLLMRDLGFPVVATSGNLSEEPICTSEKEVIARLGSIADCFLVHDRPIARHVDDSVVRVAAGRVLVLRRARGYAPLPVILRGTGKKRTTLAVGAHLKNSIALAIDRQVFVSQHIGDMSTEAAYGAFENIIRDLQKLYGAAPDRVVCDAHPDYRTTRFAESVGGKPRRIQHHIAHVFSCMAENEIDPPVLGVSWDGTGYGTDGTVWGGEFFRVTARSVERAGHLRTFLLPGGEQAVREPRRSAAGVLYEILGESAFRLDNLPPILAFSDKERGVLRAVLEKGINAPRTSSAGRLFDAVSSLAGIRQITNYEGQAAMELEFALAGVETDDEYPFEFARVAADRVPGRSATLRSDAGSESCPEPDRPIHQQGVVIADWEPMVRAILSDIAAGVGASAISAKFHNTLAGAIARIAVDMGEKRVVLTGGCFQNRYLTERTVACLERAGLRPYWHQRIPPNDGGIALGQIAAADFYEKTGDES
jgi:hydrogenase maturation protein HypF